MKTGVGALSHQRLHHACTTPGGCVLLQAVMARTGGRADNKTVSDLAKAKLAPK